MLDAVTVRLAEPHDWPVIVARHQEQNGRDGTNYPLPYFWQSTPDGHRWARNIFFALVAERDGQVVSSVYFEKCAEMCFAGVDPEATAALQREIDGAVYTLRQDGIESLHSFVPETLAGTKRKPKLVAKPLNRAGFNRVDALAHFYLDMRKQ